MPVGSLIALAIGLSMDAFAVAVASSAMLRRVSGRQIFRFAFHFGLFQAAMPIAGWAAGRSMARWVVAWDHWLAFALLSLIGGKAVIEGIRGQDPADLRAADPTRGLSLVALALATSIDALAVGLSIAWLAVPIWWPALVIGLTTASLTVLGMRLGPRLGARFGDRAAIAGGLVLIGIGLKILLEHLA